MTSSEENVDGLVYRDVFGLNLNSLARSLQRLFLLVDVGRIVDSFQSLPELSENRFQRPELGVKIGFLEPPLLAAHYERFPIGFPFPD